MDRCERGVQGSTKGNNGGDVEDGICVQRGDSRSKWNMNL